MFIVEIKKEYGWVAFVAFNTEGKINDWSVITHHFLDPDDPPSFTESEALSIENQLTSATWGYSEDNVRITKI